MSQLQLENAVLRHQVKILRRTVRRPEIRDRDRAFLAAASRALCRDRWASFMVTPQTLLRWHRELLRRFTVSTEPVDVSGFTCPDQMVPVLVSATFTNITLTVTSQTGTTTAFFPDIDP